MDALLLAKLACIGISAGLLSGLLGIGGGILIVPALIHLAGFSQLLATGTSLAILLPPVGLAAVLEYYRRGSVNLRAAVIIAVCLFLSAWASSRYAHRINPQLLKLGSGIFVTLVGLHLCLTAFART